jgi:hypothetical protein
MGIFAKLFGHKKTIPPAMTDNSSITGGGTATDPLQIKNPIIGFLNLQGEQGAGLLQTDRQILSPLFKSSYVNSEIIPPCHVLFIYCTLDAEGKMIGSETPLREQIKAAGAYVAVVASENKPEWCVKAVENRNDWFANIVLTINRKGEKFAPFFSKLFTAMFKEHSMLRTWIELAPQIPGYEHPDAPGTFVVVEAGHVTFCQ